MVQKSGGGGASNKVVGMIYPPLFVDWLIDMPNKSGGGGTVPLRPPPTCPGSDIPVISRYFIFKNYCHDLTKNISEWLSWKKFTTMI